MPEPIGNRLDLYRQMLFIRQVEETIAERYRDEMMRCPVHLSIGQEAAAVGVCAALARGDKIVSSHRSHAHYLAKGGNLNGMIAELHGRVTGCCGGRGGSMHLFDDDAGVLASVPIVGSSIPLGVGAALAVRQMGEPHIVVVFMGDAAVEEGVFHESANFSVLKHLPVIFACENNLYSVYTHLDDRQPNRDVARLAEAHGLDVARVDGNDVDRVHEAAAALAARVRGGAGPGFMQLDTYRWREHCGPNYDDDLEYRDRIEVDHWRARCPIERYARRLEEQGLLDRRIEEGLAAGIADEIDRAFDAALAAAFPQSYTGDGHVYA